MPRMSFGSPKCGIFSAAGSDQPGVTIPSPRSIRWNQ